MAIQDLYAASHSLMPNLFKNTLYKNTPTRPKGQKGVAIIAAGKVATDHTSPFRKNQSSRAIILHIVTVWKPCIIYIFTLPLPNIILQIKTSSVRYVGNHLHDKRP